MSKITVKHYLNTNLLPSLEDGILRYKIYFKVSYNRNTTQFKSIEFAEKNYTINEYNDLISTDDYKKRCEVEQQVAQNVVTAQLKMIGTDVLDRKLFASVFGHINNPLMVLMPPYATGIDKIGENNERTVISRNDNEPQSEIGIKIREIMCNDDGKKLDDLTTIYQYFTNDEQKRVNKYLIKNDIDIEIPDLNVYIIGRTIGFLNRFETINRILGIKTQPEYQKYCMTFAEKFNI